MPSDTQSDRHFLGRLLRSPLVLALIITIANALKPVVVDDTAYLFFARHIAHCPLDPYGFTVFWYTTPDPAFEVLAPPVLPYWLALGIGLFGEHVALLKLWLFPFVWGLTWSLRNLLRRFARESLVLPLIALSPAILPAVNLMLDISALALGLAAIALFARAVDRGSWRLAAIAGLLAALALQTKYTMLLIPPVIAWYGITHRGIRPALGAVAIALLVFAGWEWLLIQKYGRSHFVLHAFSQHASESPDFSTLVDEKSEFAPPLVAHFGCLAVGVGLVAIGALGVGRRWLLLIAATWAVGFLFCATVPHCYTVIAGQAGNEITAVMAFWQLAGLFFLIAIAGCAAVLLIRCRKRVRFRLNRDSLFLVGWFVIELAGYFALTPFPAARRVIGLTVVSGLLVGRVVGRVSRMHSQRRPPSWIVVLGIAAGATVCGIDVLDAFPEKVCAERASALTDQRTSGSAVWFAGHWGFQYYCERAGMRPVVPGQSVLEPGDLLVLPVHPESHGFFRPHIGQVSLKPQPEIAEQIAEVAWDDPLAAQTIPNYYGGIVPVMGRDHPRLRVVVYRIVTRWKVGDR